MERGRPDSAPVVFHDRRLYVGQHFSHGLQNIDINAIDFGAGFLPANQDPTLAAAINGSAAVASDLMRPYRGLGTIQQNTGIAWNDIHSIQTSFTRRFQHGFSFGLNYTGIVSNTQNAAPRLEHYVDSAGPSGVCGMIKRKPRICWETWRLPRTSSAEILYWIHRITRGRAGSDV